jgi:uncharacterized protein YxjI
MKLLFRQRIFSWLDSYDIFDENGETVYMVKGQLSFGHKLFIYDRYNEHVGTIKEEILTYLVFLYMKKINTLERLRKNLLYLNQVLF